MTNLKRSIFIANIQANRLQKMSKHRDARAFHFMNERINNESTYWYSLNLKAFK